EGGVGGTGRAARPAARRAVAVGHGTDLAIDLVAHPAAEAMSGEHRVLLLGGCPSSHGGCGERSGGCERRARSSLLRRAFRHASSVVAALAALAPRLVPLAHHGYPDRLLGHHMCGIAGELRLVLGERARADRVRAMCDVMVHRGPDDEGLLAHAEVALGMRRLSIVD